MHSGSKEVKTIPMSSTVEVRDPVHGSIVISREEMRIIDHAFFQRLRNIRQLGFSDRSFPGATHSRYLHSVGALHVVSEAFDSVFGLFDDDLFGDAPQVRRRLRLALRLAALLHDVGHAPLSHTTEFAMGPVSELGRPLTHEEDPQRRATHEDYTLRIIVDSSLTPLLEELLGGPSTVVAALIDPRIKAPADWFEHGGIDWRPLLSQMISSELDCDRMDYLRRDSYFTGANYGRFDLRWVLSNLTHHQVGDQAFLAVRQRALFAVEDFLLSRHHMFLMVYFHQRSVVYGEMLRNYLTDGGDGYRLPSNVEDYVGFDDPHLMQHLRASRNPWARRIVDARPYKLLLERAGERAGEEVSAVRARLSEAGLPLIFKRSDGNISKYVGDHAGPSAPIYVIGPGRRGRSGEAVSLHDAAELFRRYEEKRVLQRIYVPIECLDQAAGLADELLSSGS